MSTIDALVARTDVGWVLADEQGFVVDASEPLLVLLAWPRAALIGQPITTVVPPALRHAHHLGFSRFLASGRPTLLGTPLDLAAMTADGREVPVRVVLHADRVDGRWRFAAEMQPREASG